MSNRKTRRKMASGFSTKKAYIPLHEHSDSAQKNIMMSKPSPNIDLYCSVMEDIRRRINVLRSFLDGGSKTIYKATTVESACLQVRKVLELIALGSLVANKGEFASQNNKFETMYNARLILQDIERVNPGFYPEPFREVPSVRDGIPDELVRLEDGFLTKNRFIKIYEKCGRIMHADNPYGGTIDYHYYEVQVPVWLQEITTLLDSHIIRLINDSNMYVIHMKEADDKVHGYTFAPTSTLK
jgi:hypothetical protein